MGFDISIIIPLYKGSHFISQLLDNIYDNFKYVNEKLPCYLEVIMINDSSDEKIDNTCLLGYPFPIQLFNNNNNMGIHFSRVKGLKKAKGRYVLFLDQDDVLDRKFIYSQMLGIKDHAVIVCNGIYRNNRLIIPNDRIKERIEDEEYYFSSLSEIISPGQVMIKRDSIPAEWTEHILKNNYCDDALLWLLMKNAGIRFYVNEEVLYFHNEGNGNTSFQWSHNAAALQELYDVICEKGLIQGERLEKLKQCIEGKVSKHLQYAELENALRKIDVTHVAEFMRKKRIFQIAVYGYGVFGKKFVELMSRTEIDIRYVIDANAEAFVEETVRLCHPDDELEEVDAVIITTIFTFESVKKKLQKKMQAKILSLDILLKEVDATETR